MKVLLFAFFVVVAMMQNDKTSVARELAPARLRSSRKPSEYGVPDAPRLQDLGPLCSPAGASSLATEI
ncbi:hypothetical protein BK670_21985 [Pseudomonas fluorescens]|uniref:Uncharacterized protein n=1 Tax=Pseudomonas fluorescens TaxID=294 RepID=A0A423M6X6_PSEFL|nr:hypothetical protein BK670_21985 [Pseudomonas fluorescens]